MTDYAALRDVIAPLRAAQYDWTPGGVRAAWDRVVDPSAIVHMCHPFGDVAGNDAMEHILAPLHAAMPDVERRDWIVMSGPDGDGADWVGCAGTFVGTFLHPFLDIPPTGHLAHMRYHEFYRIKDAKVVEVQAIWDLPELMMQAGAWPMAPSLGREARVPGPAGGHGVLTAERDAQASDTSLSFVREMLTAMGRHPKEPPEAMLMPRYWHPKMTWYGPAGIGTARGIAGFRNWHQIPFLAAMPDRGRYKDTVGFHFFADGAFVGVTGWPNMRQTLTHDGWLGIAPAGKTVEMRSLDFWRIEAGLIRENWVLLDLLDIYRQLGVDVLARMRQFNLARPTGHAAIAQEYA